jgi:hypothetical protein
MNLHDREESVNEMKKALTPDKGVAMFRKGDVPGHDFHGNQYTVGSGANKVSDSKSWSKKQRRQASKRTSGGQRMSEALKRHYGDPEARERNRLSQEGVHRQPEKRAAASLKAKAHAKAHPEKMATHSEAIKAFYERGDNRAVHSVRMREFYKTEDGKHGS